MAVRIAYETHATTTDNEAGIASGWRQGVLSPLGREQARELGTRRREDGLAAVVSSDLARSVDTARIAFAGSPVPLHQDPRLRECDYGELTGRPSAELAALRPRHLDRPFPGGQSYRDVETATAALLRDLATRFDGRRVLLVASTANLWSLQSLLTGASWPALLAAPFEWRPGWEFTLPTPR
ncbi:histidine phosphatase family protein [Streptomyces sp. B6B3]|uniref:histidine phosphatase family protein n=1 Tax=Streptomyces sp. B6B3 TaxID=3153570 RepID=UPI00325C7502